MNTFRCTTSYFARRPHRVVTALVLFSAGMVAGGAAPAAAQSVWELTPYRVHVAVVLDRVPELTPRLQADLVAGLVERSDAVVGSAWNLQADAAPPELARAVRRGLPDIALSDVPKSLLKSDKVMLLRVSKTPAGYRVAARELDIFTELFGTIAAAEVGQRSLLADEAFRAVLEAFAPLAEVEEVEGLDVKIRLRAGALPTRDEELQLAGKDLVYRLALRYEQRDGSAKSIRHLPWTYLATEEFARPVVHCRMYSGLRSALSGRRRGRVRQLALAVKPTGRSTRVELFDRTKPDVPLEGYEVYGYGPDSPETTLLGYTDRLGGITVAPGEHALRLLIFKNGGEFLARLPLIPGLEATSRAPVANDDQRLQIEGFIDGLQKEVIEVVTRREVYMHIIRARLESGDGDKATKLLERLHALPSRDTYLARLRARERLVFTNDARVKRKVEKLFADTRELLNRYLDPAPVEKVAVEVGAAG